MGVKPDRISKRTKLRLMVLANALAMVGPTVRVSDGIHGPIGWFSLAILVGFAVLLVMGLWELQKLPKDE